MLVSECLCAFPRYMKRYGHIIEPEWFTFYGWESRRYVYWDLEAGRGVGVVAVGKLWRLQFSADAISCWETVVRGITGNISDLMIDLYDTIDGLLFVVVLMLRRNAIKCRSVSSTCKHEQHAYAREWNKNWSILSTSYLASVTLTITKTQLSLFKVYLIIPSQPPTSTYQHPLTQQLNSETKVCA